MIFLTLLLIPTVVSLIAFLCFEKRITLKEFMLQMGIQTIVIFGLFMILRYANTTDTEIQNGLVSSKTSQHVSCEHSYRCFCVTISCGKNCTQQICQTCYEHSYDVDWNVFTTNHEQLTIDRINRQGTSEPPRWTSVIIGEPTSRAYSFENYIKASPDSLFRHQGLIEKYASKIQPYPKDVFDYYRINRVLSVDGALPNIVPWNDALSILNGILGPKKQVNVVLVFTKGLPHEYYSAIEQAWLGGKKNDVVIVMGVNSSTKTLSASWVEVMSWTNREIFKVVLRDDLLRMKDLTPQNTMPIISADIEKYFVRRHWDDFSYLMHTSTPTKGQWIFALLFGFFLAVGISWWVEENDVFDEELN